MSRPQAGLLDLGDVPAWLRILVAGWPAVAFLGGTLLAHGAPAPDGDEVRVPDQVEAPATPVTTPAPALPAADPQPAAQPSAAPVPPALVALARKVADDHRTRTGTDIDTTTLRTRLGVPLPLAEVIAAQLP